MKDADSIWFVLTADQRRSRHTADRVPDALDRLGHIAALRLGFERTAGDEIQALTADPDAVVDIVGELTRLGNWRVGIGAGPVEHPLPRSTRQARGPAYIAARSAVDRASSAPTALSLALSPSPLTTTVDLRRHETARRAEAALWLLRTVLGRRTNEGWQVADLLDSGLSNQDAADRLGITPSAASQRSKTAAVGPVVAGRKLASELLAEIQQ